MSDDFLPRARMALSDMRGRVEAGKLEMFERTIQHAEAYEARATEAEAERDALRAVINRAGALASQRASHAFILDALNRETDT